MTLSDDASTGAVSIAVVEDTHTFEAEDGTNIWCGGYTPVDEDGLFLREADHHTPDPRCFFCRVAGTSYRRDALQREDLKPGASVLLRPESDNQHDANAIAVWDPSGTVQLGYLPADLSPVLRARVPAGRGLGEVFGGVVITEFRRDSEVGARIGLRILVGPVGDLMLHVRESDDKEDDSPFAESSEGFETMSDQHAETFNMAAVTCPACGSAGQAFAGVGGFRCKACQRDAWVLSCRRCRNACTIYGSSTGAGTIDFRCQRCSAKNVVAKQQLRAISADVRRHERLQAAGRREAAAREKAAKTSQAEALQQETAERNETLGTQLHALDGALAAAIQAPPFGFASLKAKLHMPAFEPGRLNQQEIAPTLDSFVPVAPKALGALIPGAKRRYEEERQAAEKAFTEAGNEHEVREAKRKADLAKAETDHAAKLSDLEAEMAKQHAEVDELERNFQAGQPEAVIEFVSAAVAAEPLPFEPPAAPRIGFSPESQQMVIEVQLPSLDVIPDARAYRYIKTRNEIVPTPMPSTERKRRYASLVAQIALLTTHCCFASDVHGVIETVIVNGHVATTDKRTGRDINPCLVTVRTTRDSFAELDLARVDPIECLKGLRASISRSPAELVPVRPIIEFDMADPRFVKEEQILETLDTRPNLMELTPKEFESLITNLFEKMGLETRLTQPSRDGGVDCVAYDSRPIFGGKVVIQAKRYKHTVGVSAVRDLFGTMQNEGATKGILVTTSGYGQASHEFANGKPLELIDGGNLLYLLHEHAGIDAKIEVPEDWIDPPLPS
jgi:restriction system protein